MIVIGLGANLPSEYGTPAETLEAAKIALESCNLKIIKSSRTYLSAPVPMSDAPWYANSVVSIGTDLNANNLLYALNKIEADFGRVRTYRNASRILDLDIISYNEESVGVNGDHLCLPHPRMHERAFVLKPMYEIAPDWIHPSLKSSISSLIEEGEKSQCNAFKETVPLEIGEEYRVAG